MCAFMESGQTWHSTQTERRDKGMMGSMKKEGKERKETTPPLLGTAGPSRALVFISSLSSHTLTHTHTHTLTHTHTHTLTHTHKLTHTVIWLWLLRCQIY